MAIIYTAAFVVSLVAVFVHAECRVLVVPASTVSHYKSTCRRLPMNGSHSDDAIQNCSLSQKVRKLLAIHSIQLFHTM